MNLLPGPGESELQAMIAVHRFAWFNSLS